VAAITLAFAVASGAGAAPRGGQTHANDHARIVQYWSPDRVAKAIPREVSPEKNPRFAPQVKPSKPGGGGSGGSGTSTTGSHWTNQNAAVFNTTGKVLFTMAGIDYVCSGAVVDDGSLTNGKSLILTAGHCVYDETHHAFATNWMFVPAYEDGGSIVTSGSTHSFTCDTTKFGCWTATALTTTTAWATGNSSPAAFNNDYAFATVGPGGKTATSNTQLDATVGANAIDFNVGHPTQVYAFGYPQASPYDGQKLIYCAGTDVADTWGGTSDFGLNCGMTGGSSGGPWFVDFKATSGTGTLTSVNSFKYTAGPYSKYMWGPYFGDYAQKTYTEAKGATTNRLISN
jgi:hypothetical protein